jgi:hypothetical protein
LGKSSKIWENRQKFGKIAKKLGKITENSDYSIDPVLMKQMALQTFETTRV